MKKRGDLVSEDHIVKIWMVIIGSGLIALIFPPIATITFLAMGYWLVLFSISLLKLLFEHAARPARPARPVRVNPKDTAVAAAWSGDWEPAWMAVCESPAEEAFLRASISHFNLSPSNRVLAGGGITFDMQHVISSMRVDFLINDRLVIEVDGAAWHSSPRQVRNDAQRDTKLVSLGYVVLRISAKKVFEQPNAAMQDVVDAISRMAP